MFKVRKNFKLLFLLSIAATSVHAVDGENSSSAFQSGVGITMGLGVANSSTKANNGAAPENIKVGGFYTRIGINRNAPFEKIGVPNELVDFSKGLNVKSKSGFAFNTGLLMQKRMTNWTMGFRTLFGSMGNSSRTQYKSGALYLDELYVPEAQPVGNAQPQQGGNAQPQQGGNAQPQQGGNAQPQQGGNAQPQQGGNAQPQQGGNAQPQQGGNAQPAGNPAQAPGMLRYNHAQVGVSDNNIVAFQLKNKWFASFIFEFGYIIGNRVQLFAGPGVSLQRQKLSCINSSGKSSGGISKTVTTPMIALGARYAMTNRMSLGIEYQRQFMNKKTWNQVAKIIPEHTTAFGAPTFKTNNNVFLVTLTYMFSAK